MSGRSEIRVDDALGFEMKILDLLSTLDDSNPDATGCLGQAGLILACSRRAISADSADTGDNAMFFNSKKKVAEEIAMEIEVGFLPFFQELGRVEPNGQFHPPEGFYFDSYILGFVITSASMLRDYKYKMKNVAGEKKAMLLLDVLEALSIKPQEAKLLRDYQLNNWHALQQKPEYCDGADHALFIFGLSNGMTSQTHPAPVIQQSLLEAKNLVAAGLAHETKGPQIAALANNTIGAHIRANYSS